jgi:hypothetical protein
MRYDISTVNLLDELTFLTKNARKTMMKNRTWSPTWLSRGVLQTFQRSAGAKQGARQWGCDSLSCTV